jgi:4a-hydroxytetrahydrobiopterin dehydratase
MPLTDVEISSRLKSLPDWKVESVGDLAEKAGHHPDIDIRYNRVRLALVTHDAGGITAKDFELAAAASKQA